MKKKLIYFIPNDQPLVFNKTEYKLNSLQTLEHKFMTYIGFKVNSDKNIWELNNSGNLNFLTDNEFESIYNRINYYIENLKFYSCIHSNINQSFCKLKKIKIEINQCFDCIDYKLDPKFDNLETKTYLIYN